MGNVVLKMLEGVSETVVRLASYAYKEKLMWRAGLAMLSGGIGRLKELTDWKQYGGAPLLGFDRVMIKAHGRSHAHALQNAVKVAAKTVATGMVQRDRALAARDPGWRDRTADAADHDADHDADDRGTQAATHVV